MHPADFPNRPPNLIPNFNGHVCVGTERKAEREILTEKLPGLEFWFLLFLLREEGLWQSRYALPESAALHWGPKFLSAFPLEQRPSLAFKMPGQPQLGSQPLSAAARGSPRRRWALTQPQSGSSADQDLESARPEAAGEAPQRLRLGFPELGG